MRVFDGLVAGVIVAALSGPMPAWAAGPTSGPPGGAGSAPAAAPPGSRPPGAPPSGPASAAGSSSQSSPPAPQVSQDAAARSRMHECGHQWSSMKKAGTVGLLTWKEFSAGCLALNK